MSHLYYISSRVPTTYVGDWVAVCDRTHDACWVYASTVHGLCPSISVSNFDADDATSGPDMDGDDAHVITSDARPRRLRRQDCPSVVHGLAAACQHYALYYILSISAMHLEFY